MRGTATCSHTRPSSRAYDVRSSLCLWCLLPNTPERSPSFSSSSSSPSHRPALPGRRGRAAGPRLSARRGWTSRLRRPRATASSASSASRSHPPRRRAPRRVAPGPARWAPRARMRCGCRGNRGRGGRRRGSRCRRGGRGRSRGGCRRSRARSCGLRGSRPQARSGRGRERPGAGGGVHATAELRAGVDVTGRGFAAVRRGVDARAGAGASGATRITVTASGVRSVIEIGPASGTASTRISFGKAIAAAPPSTASATVSARAEISLMELPLPAEIHLHGTYRQRFGELKGE